MKTLRLWDYKVMGSKLIGDGGSWHSVNFLKAFASSLFQKTNYREHPVGIQSCR
jgi:hypothetical protein